MLERKRYAYVQENIEKHGKNNACGNVHLQETCLGLDADSWF